VNKTAASAAQLAKCILLHASARTTVAPMRLKILKKLKTASLNSEFTGSYKKSVMNHLDLSSITYFSHCLFCFKNAKTNTTLSNNVNKLKEQQKQLSIPKKN